MKSKVFVFAKDLNAYNEFKEKELALGRGEAFDYIYVMDAYQLEGVQGYYYKMLLSYTENEFYPTFEGYIETFEMMNNEYAISQSDAMEGYYQRLVDKGCVISIIPSIVKDHVHVIVENPKTNRIEYKHMPESVARHTYIKPYSNGNPND